MTMVRAQEEPSATSKRSRSWSSVGLVWALLLVGCKTTPRVPSQIEDPCNAGGAPGCSTPFVLYEEKEYARAAASWTKSCEGGQATDCYNLGVLFEKGRSVGKDDARAAALYTKACEGGEVSGCFNLGVLFENGRGVGKDDARAAALYTKACEGGEGMGSHDLRLLFGVGTACYNLGLLFAEGRGVGKDEARAAALYTMACEEGEPKGCPDPGPLPLVRASYAVQ